MNEAESAVREGPGAHGSFQSLAPAGAILSPPCYCARYNPNRVKSQGNPLLSSGLKTKVTEGLTRLHQLNFKNANEPQIEPSLFLYAQKCLCFSEGRSTGCSAEHHLRAGSCVKPSEGSGLSSHSLMQFILGVYHISVAGDFLLWSSLYVQGDHASCKQCLAVSTLAGTS